MIQLQPGSVSKEQAQTNRENVEIELFATRIAVLPQGDIMFDRAVQVPSGARIVGAGIDSTRISQPFTEAPYGDNCTLQITNPSGVGYADSLRVIDRNSVELLTGDPVNYPVGGWLFTWLWNSFSEVGVRRHQIVAKKGSRILRLSQDVDPSANAACYFRPKNSSDKWWRRTDGPVAANEIFGEARSSERPYRREYKYPIDIGTTLTENVRIENLTIGMPKNPAVQCFHAKWVAGLSFYRVRFENGMTIGNGTNCTLESCEGPSLSFNGLEDSLIQNFRGREIYFEEGCIDVDCRGIRLVNCPGNAFHANTRCERIRLVDFRIENCSGMPISVDGQECMVSRGVIACQNNFDVHSYIKGDRGIVENLVSNRGVVLVGQNLRASNVIAPGLSIGFPGQPGRGMWVNCTNVSEYPNG